MDYLKIKKKIIIPNLLFAGVLILYVLTFFNNLLTLPMSVYLTFFINFIVVVIGILKCNLPISIDKINWYFFLIFLIIIPFYQLTSGYAPRNMFLTESEIVFTNVLILIWCICYYVSYNLKSSEKRVKIQNKLTFPQEKSFYIFLIVASLICLSYVMVTTSLVDPHIRESLEQEANTFGILVFFLTRSIPAISLSIILWTKKKKISIFPDYQMNLMGIILFVITFILNNPITSSRFLSGAVYIGLLISAFNLSFFKGKRFDVLIIFSIVIVFPLMYAFKMYSLEQILSPNVTLEINNYNSVDFDAYQMIGRTIRYVERYGYHFGGQLRSVLLFFVPRDILNIKGTPSGELVATIQNVSYTNLSSPIVAEGFIDFGVLGVVAYSFIFGKIAKFIDNKTYKYKNDFKKVYYIEIVFSFILGFFVFIYRGALQPTVLRLMGFFLFLILLYFINKLTLHFKHLFFQRNHFNE